MRAENDASNTKLNIMRISLILFIFPPAKGGAQLYFYMSVTLFFQLIKQYYCSDREVFIVVEHIFNFN